MEDSRKRDDDDAEHEAEVGDGESYSKTLLNDFRLENSSVDSEHCSNEPCFYRDGNTPNPRNKIGNAKSNLTDDIIANIAHHRTIATAKTIKYIAVQWDRTIVAKTRFSKCKVGKCEK